MKLSRPIVVLGFLFVAAAMLVVGVANGQAVSTHAKSVGPLVSTATAAIDKSYHGSVGPYLPLNILWRIRTGGADRTITVDPGERDRYPLDGALFYVPMTDHPALGTVPLYRLYNGADHMVSLNPHEGETEGYHLEGILGYPFVLRQPGTTELIRTFDPSTGHHSLRNATGLETEQGYVDEPMGVFGYPRYYNQREKLLTLSGGGITVESNEAAGGALWIGWRCISPGPAPDRRPIRVNLTSIQPSWTPCATQVIRSAVPLPTCI